MLSNMDIKKNIANDLSCSMRLPLQQRALQVISTSSLEDTCKVFQHPTLSDACFYACQTNEPATVFSLLDGELWILKRDTLVCINRKIPCLSYYEMASNIKSARAAGPVHLVQGFPDDVLNEVRAKIEIEEVPAIGSDFSYETMMIPIPFHQWTRMDATCFSEKENGNSYPAGTVVELKVVKDKEILVLRHNDKEPIACLGTIEQIVRTHAESTKKHYLLASEIEEIDGYTSQLVASHRCVLKNGKPSRQILIHGPSSFFDAINRLKPA